MSPAAPRRDPKLKLTPEVLARLREEAAAARARTEAAWTRAASAAPPPEATRDEPERALRSLALGVAALAAYLPSALLADGQDGHLVGWSKAVKNATVVALLTLVPAFSSARTERTPGIEDSPASRFARRFSPLVVGILFMLAPLLLAPLAPALKWQVVEAALIAQAFVGFQLHVGRARACHTFAVLWGALASTILDERAGIGLAVAFALIVLAAVLDRSLDVRGALGGTAPPAELGLLLRATALVLGAGAVLFGGAFWLVRDLVERLPTSVTATTPARAEDAPSTVDLFLALAAVVLMLGAYHLVFGRLERRGEESAAAEDEAAPPLPAIVPLAESPPIDTTGWPPGPRRDLVERYLAHLARLRALGTRRAAAQAPLELAQVVGERVPGLLERARRLAWSFQRARYSPAAVAPDVVAEAAVDAGAIETALERARAEGRRPRADR